MCVRGEGVDKGRERDIGCAHGARWRAGTRGGRVRGRCAVEGVDKGRERDIGCADGARWRAGTRGGSAISGARTVRGGGRGQGAGARTVRSGGRGQGAGARYRVRGRCAVEGIGCADGGRGQGAGARYEVRGRCAVEDKGRERGRCAVEGGDKGRERDIGCADSARWRAWESCGLPFCQYVAACC